MKYSRCSIERNHKVAEHTLPNDPNNDRAHRSTAETCQCYNPMNLLGGHMNEYNWAVM